MTLFGALESLRARPIPAQAEMRARTRGYRQSIKVDVAALLFSEALVEARETGLAGENYYYSERNPPYWRRVEGSTPALLLRKTLAAKLMRANERIGSAGLELYLFDAWRPRAVQAYFHDHWMPAELGRRGCTLEGAALAEEIERYWAAPTADPASPAPHATGGAVDLTLRWKDGAPLWMGSIFDDVTVLAHRDHFEISSSPGLSFSDEEARAGRRLLHWLLTDEGLAGHPNEWWHFSWGDQFWAASTGATAACYGLASPGGAD